MDSEKSLLLEYLYITAVVATYWIVSISMVFINKTLLSSHTVDLNAPFFITWFQCIITVVIILLIERIAIIFPKYFTVPSKKQYVIDREVSKKIFLLSFIFTAMIASNNLCLKYVGVAFYYVGRSLTTIFNVIFTFIILGEKLSIATLICCIVIISGFIVGVDQENLTGSLSTFGLFSGILSSLTLSLYSIGTKKILPHINGDIWRLSYYNNVYSSFMFLPLIWFNGELETLYNYTKFSDISFWAAMITAGFFGFAIGYIIALQIKVTSPLTSNISGTAKSCTQTVIATYWYDNKKTFLWWFSNFLVLSGSAAYARIKQIQMQKQSQRSLER